MRFQVFHSTTSAICKQNYGLHVRSIATQKSLSFRQSAQFTNLDHGQTGTLENKVQRTLRKNRISCENSLSPLAKSKYTINSLKQYVNYIKKQKVPDEYEIILFDVTSILANVLVDQTIDIILQRIYIEKKTDTTIPKREVKDYTYVKNVLLILTVKFIYKLMVQPWFPLYDWYQQIFLR